jgi:virginiamycin A acetyltransferase
MDIHTALEKVLIKSGYPRPSHGLVNAFASTTNLSVAESAQVSRNSLLRGDVRLDADASIGTGCELVGDVAIGEGTNVEPDCEFVGDIDVGKYCAIARKNLFQQQDHQTQKPAMQMRFYRRVLDSELEHVSSGSIDIGNDVWIGTRSKILSGVTIGSGTIVGAGSVVTKDVEPYAVVAGVPARRVRWRFPEAIREKLLDLAWWEWDEETLYRHREFFDSKIRDVDDIPDVA